MEIAVSTSPAHIMMTRRKNTWYSVRDGNWNDPNTWMSNVLDKRMVTMPRAGDDVYILHNVLHNISTTVNNLYIQGKLTSANVSLTLSVTGDLQVAGTIDLTGSNTNLLLYGYNNFINSFTAGNSTITYTRAGDQNVMDLGYKNLNIWGSTGTKYLTANTVINNNLVINGFNPGADSTLECGVFDLTVGGTTNVTYGETNRNNNISKSGSGNLLFTGLLTYVGDVNFNSNINTEFRGGVTINFFNGAIFNGPVNFTTNSQNLSNQGATFNAEVTIIGPITVTNNTSTPTIINNGINGTVSGSTINNDGKLYLGSINTPMTTGIWNYNHGVNSTLGYDFNGDYTLPYTSYINLAINGTGIKRQGGNITVSKNLIINDLGHDGNYECAGFDLTVGGTFLNQGSFTANSFCNIMFTGLANFSNGNNSSVGLDLRIGNPDVEFKGGLTIAAYKNYTGTGVFKFSTNNQNLFFQNIISGIWDANILIDGSVTLLYSGGGIGQAGSFINGNINGGSSSDIFVNSGFIIYNNSTAPMSVGKLYCNQYSNTWVYNALGNQDITTPSAPTPGYRNLTLQGSGSKKLVGNVSVKGTYILNLPATLDSNGFLLTNP